MSFCRLELLWKAPEILRNNSQEPTKEGDIYSSSMVLFEITTRNTPFENFQTSLGCEGNCSVFACLLVLFCFAFETLIAPIIIIM